MAGVVDHQELLFRATKTKMAIALVSVLLLPSAAVATHIFDDVDDNRFYADPVEWAFNNGITTGTSAITLDPDRGVTRGESVTGLAAACFGLADRGVIVPGRAADLVLFDPETVTDNATYDEPEVPSSGIRAVWVNGGLTWDRDRVTGRRPGRFLTHDHD